MCFPEQTNNSRHLLHTTSFGQHSQKHIVHPEDLPCLNSPLGSILNYTCRNTNRPLDEKWPEIYKCFYDVYWSTVAKCRVDPLPACVKLGLHLSGASSCINQLCISPIAGMCKPGISVCDSSPSAFLFTTFPYVPWIKGRHFPQ